MGPGKGRQGKLLKGSLGGESPREQAQGSRQEAECEHPFASLVLGVGTEHTYKGMRASHL